ncbi:MAG TPA: FHA domain-containing protein [Pirellulales bacterium]|nr:FHA domain-containing protein [Pirellulales bacterium]
MSAPSDSPAMWFACPSCHTLCHDRQLAESARIQVPPVAEFVSIPGHVAESAGIQGTCPHCGLPLGWVEETLEFRSALAVGNRAWRPRLCLVVEWPGGKTEVRANGDGPLDLTVDGKDPLRVKLEAACGPLAIENAGISLELPGEVRFCERRLVAWLEAELTSAPAPRPIGRLGQFKTLKEARAAVRFGRDAADPRQDMVLADEGVSFHHAVAVCAAAHGSYWIADAGSSEGTFVHGEPIVAWRPAIWFKSGPSPGSSARPMGGSSRCAGSKECVSISSKPEWLGGSDRLT